MSRALEVWVVDDDRAIRWVLERALRDAGHNPRCFSDGQDLLRTLQRDTPSVLVTDIRMPGPDGLQVLDKVRTGHPGLPVIIITAHSDLDSAVAAYRGGAFEYLPKPFDVDEAVDLVERAAAETPRTQDQAEPGRPATPLIGEAPAMQEVFRAIGRLRNSHINVLITGESGTGKELVARALHDHSPRAAEPFIAINTAAIPKELLESEFFGHERGSFTGAQSQRRGRFEQAHQGTLFLDEIGEMAPDLQTRLLRVLNDGSFYRVGGHQLLSSDVRVIAATNQELEAAVNAGQFREDLFHRLNVIWVRVPPLRARAQDIASLLDHFLGRAARELGVERKYLRHEVVDALSAFAWPGNVRQLENVCRWLTVMAPGSEVYPEDLPPEVRDQHGGVATNAVSDDWQAALRRWVDQRLAAGAADLLDEAVPALERIFIRAALERTHGRRQAAARLLGLGRNTLTRKIRELSVQED